MSEKNPVKIELTHIEGLEFKLKFDQESPHELHLGGSAGPGASRLLAAAAAQCLSASLLYCVAKNSPPPGSLRTHAVCSMVRNEQGRQRIGSITVILEVDPELEQALRMQRCLNLYQDFSTVAASLRQGFPINVRVLNAQGETLHQSPDTDAK